MFLDSLTSLKKTKCGLDLCPEFLVGRHITENLNSESYPLWVTNTCEELEKSTALSFLLCAIPKCTSRGGTASIFSYKWFGTSSDPLDLVLVVTAQAVLSFGENLSEVWKKFDCRNWEGATFPGIEREGNRYWWVFFHDCVPLIYTAMYSLVRISVTSGLKNMFEGGRHYSTQ